MKPLVIASECGAENYAKNTLAGFRHCLKHQIDGIEFDVHLSRDTQVVVQHDYHLNKHATRDATGHYLPDRGAALCDLSLDEIKSFEVGRYAPESREARSYPSYTALDNEKIPTLSELLSADEESNHNPQMWIELKTTPFNREYSADPVQLIDSILTELEKFPGVAQRTVLLAFEWDVLLAAKQRAPELETDFLTINHEFIRKGLKPDDNPYLIYGRYSPESYQGDYAAAIAAAGGDWWGPYVNDVNADDILKAQALGVRVNVWGVESTENNIEQALELNANAITLSDPLQLKERLNHTKH